MPISTLSLFLAGLLWLGHGTLAMAANELPVSSFEAHYEVSSSGLAIGESVMTLADEGNGRYRMHSEIRPTGLAALLIAEQLNERVSGEVKDGLIRPASYEQQRTGVKESQTTQLTFDWQDETVNAQSNGEQATLPLEPRVVDPLSLHLLVMGDLQQGRTPSQYTIVDETELKTYQVNVEGEETLKTPLGALRTVRVSRSRPDSSRVTTLWFAPDLKYLVVQIAQKNEGRETLRMLIQEVKGL